MKSIKFALLLGLTFSVFRLSTASAQNTLKGKITGKVFDKNNNEAIIGSVVMIEGTTIGAQTDFDGNYIINNLNPGTYKLVFKYFSYETKTVEGVVVTAGKITNLNMVMSESSKALQEVVVTSTYRKESIGAMYSIQKNNIAISDGIASDLIKKSPD